MLKQQDRPIKTVHLQNPIPKPHVLLVDSSIPDVSRLPKAVLPVAPQRDFEAARSNSIPIVQHLSIVTLRTRRSGDRSPEFNLAFGQHMGRP